MSVIILIIIAVIIIIIIIIIHFSINLPVTTKKICAWKRGRGGGGSAHYFEKFSLNFYLSKFH